MEAIEGPLWEGVLPGVLRTLFVGRKTGVLSFELKGERRSVQFLGGNIVSANSSVRDDWMGEILVRQGSLSKEDLKRAVGFALRDKRRLGVVLQELGLLDADGLEEAVGDHVKHVLGRVFSWSDGRYRFEEEPEEQAREGDVTLRLSTGELILEAARSVSDPDVVRFNLGDIDRVVALSNDPLLRFQRISLSPADGFVLSRVNGRLTGRELQTMVPLSEEQFHRSLFGLLSAGVVDFLSQEEAEGEVTGTPPEEKPAVEAPREPPVPEWADETMVIPSDLPPDTRESAIEKTSVDPPPGQSAIEKTVLIPPPGQSAVEKTVLIPPPERSSVEGMEPPGESPAEQTMIMPSLRSLPIGETMSLPRLDSDGEGAPLKASEAEKTQELAPVDTRRLEVLEAYENLAARTHFEVLGVPRDAREAQVREAYFRLARRFHPDVHHDPALSDLRERLEEIFGRLGEAYEVLCSPRLRARYEKQLAEQVARPETRARRDPEEEAMAAEEAIAKGAESIAQERYSEAIQQLEPAISRARGVARSRGRILLARAYAEHPNWVKQGEELLLSVLLEEPENDDALLLLGRIYGGLGLRSRAVAMLHRVLDRSPGNPEARGLIAEIGRTPLAPGPGHARMKSLLGWKP
jgi:tetratricopeptide (TPR) repeat protein